MKLQFSRQIFRKIQNYQISWKLGQTYDMTKLLVFFETLRRRLKRNAVLVFIKRWFAAIFSAGQGNNNNLDFKLKEVLLYTSDNHYSYAVYFRHNAVISQHLFLTIFRRRNKRLASNTTWKFGHGTFHRKLDQLPPYAAQIICVTDVPRALYNAIGIQNGLFAGLPRNRGSIPGRDKRGSWPHPAFSSVISACSTFFWM